jgi:hypothetical protein
MSSAPQNQAYGSAAPVPAGMPPGVKYLGTIQASARPIGRLCRARGSRGHATVNCD